MKQKYLFILYLFFTFVQIFAQNTGDFRSNTTSGNWESASSWQVYNGSSWIAAGVYPGQSTGTYSVTISSVNTISITSNLTTAEMGSVIVNGTLDLNPPSPFNITLSTLHLFIDGGVLNFNGPQISLNLPLRASPNPSPYIEIKNGGIIGGSCTHNDEILIGNNVYAVCKTTGSSDYVTFGEIATSGGTINAVINLPPSNTTSCKDQPITLEGHYEGAAGSTVNYQWTATDPNGDPIIIPIATGTLSNNSDLASTSFTPGSFGNYLISFTVSTDISGINFSNTVTNLVTIEDTQAPVFSLSPANISIACNASSLPAATNGPATATDNCDTTPTITYSDVISAVNGNNKIITRTWTATDDNGNSSSYEQTITVTDTQAPVFSLSPANISIACNASSLPAATNGPATATDNCDTTPTITYSDVISAVNGNNKIITRTWTATDDNGNSSSYEQTITVTDTQAPVFSLSPANISIACNASSLPAATNGPATATDNCDTTPTITYSDVISAVNGNNKIITRTWTATDDNGNSSSFEQIITVTDTQAPVFSLSPANISIACNASSLPAATNGPATATDNCDTTPTITYSDVISAVNGNNKIITRTWTATDDNGNSSSFEQIITVTDTQAPVFSLSPANISIACNASSLPAATNGPATATDNCDTTPTITYSDVISAVNGNNKIITRTWTATDDNGNSSSFEQIITVTDTQAPVFSLSPANISIACNASSLPAATNGPATATDNCDTTPTITYSDVISAVNGNNKIITRTWTATDDNGNSSSFEQIITVTDTQAPVFSLSPANISIACNASSLPAATNGPATATDNCDTTPTITYSDVISAVNGNNKIITRTWTATDDNGNSSSFEQIITVTDTQAPVFSLSPANISIACNASSLPAATNGPATATDNCDTTPTITYSDVISAVNGNNKIITRTWTATDDNGNSSSYEQTITVTDTQAPVFSLSPANISIACNASSLPAATNGPATATDNCDTTPTITYSDVISAVNGNNKIITRTWTATDDNGNSSSFEQIITVTDTQAPVFSLSPANISIACNASSLPAATNGPATATDNCDTTPTITYSDVISAVNGNNKIITRTWTATDDNGNSSSFEQIITVTDTQAPVFSLSPANISIACNASSLPAATNGPATATDNCDTTPTITYSDVISAVNGNNKTITRIWTATDDNGNSSSFEQIITVTDTQAPVFSLSPANISITCNTSSLPAATNGPATATDNCDTTPTITYSDVISAVNGNNKTITRIWTATDDNGNSSSYEQTITVTDTQAPVITCPINKTVNTSADGTGNCTTTATLGTPTATDNCTTAGNFTFTAKVGGTIINPATYLFSKGSTTVAWTATDESGNTSTPCNQIVTVIDNEAPTISCPANKTVNTSADGTGDCTTTVNVGTPITSDNCGVSSIVARVSGVIINTNTYQFPTGNTTINWTVTDNAGLTASCDQIITVIDDENPVISCPGDQNVFFNNNCQYSLQNYTSLATSSDNCDNNITITQSPAAGTLISAAQTTVTLTATDDANRTSSCTFKVNATDNIPPTAVCKNYTAYLSSNGTINVAASDLNNGSSDNCGIANMTITPNAFTCSNIGANNVVFTVYDNGGNSSSCNAVITVVDNTPPTVICKNFVVVVDAITRVATIKASDIDNGSNDACGIASISVSPSQFADSPNIYTATTILTVTDVNNNTSSCTATVTVEPPKNLNTYLTGVIVNPVPDNPQAPSALVEVTACPGGITVPKDIQFTLQAIGTYNLQASQVLNWEYSNDNGETWITIPNTAGLLTYTLTGLTSDTFVRLRITDADDSSIIKTSAEAYARFLPPDEPPIIVSHSALDICLGDSVTVNAESFYDQPAGQFGKGGKFNYAQPDGWRVDGLDGYFPASGDNGSETTWKETNSNSNATFSGINYDTTDNTKFAIAHGVANYTTLETPVFSTIGMTSSEAILSFNTSYYFCNGGYGEIWLSFDSGNTYTVKLNTNQNYDFDSRTGGTTTSGVKLAKGSGNKCIGRTDPRKLPATLNLGQYAGLSGLRVMFKFYGSTASCGSVSSSTIPNPDNVSCNVGNTLASGWAIDDVGFAFAQVDDELEWTDEDGNVIAKGTTATVTPVTPGIREYGVTTLVNGCRTDNDTGTNFINVNTSLAYAGEDYAPLASNCGENSIQLNAYDNTKTAVTNYNKGAWKANLYTVPDTASGDTDYPGTGITGSWSIISATSTSCGNSATFSSTTDPDAIFTADPGTYVLRWTLTNGCFDEKSITFIDCKSVDFDGNNDYVSFKDNYNLTGNFSIETWVKPNAVNGTRTVISRKDAGNNTKGYDLSIVNGQVQFNYHNASGANSITTGSYSISTGRWYHLAVTFDGATYKLYVDGLQLATKNGAAPAATDSTTEALLGAMDQVSTTIPVNYFYGWMDEVKIWNKALGVEQIRQMMNQEIDASGSDVGGVVIPLRISGTDNDSNGIEDNPLLWNDLAGYYRMNVNCGDLTAYKGVSGRLHNINSSEQQTAPIPYTSRVSNQTWDTDNTWTNYDVWDVPNSLGINNQPIDWNIVKTNHKITANSQDLILLGLIVMSNELIITNSGTQNETNPGHGLWITHYLKLDGKMDLVGESQLVQKRYNATQFSESNFEENSTGYIERDQQGKQNSFNYNYWSSPVSNRGAANNSSYSMATILRDGTDSANPKTITFGDGPYFADGPLTSPIKISNRWIWTYSSLTPDSNSNWDNYWQWQYKSSTGLINVADGFSMKGSGGSAPIDAFQNYIYTGKPNSGTISKFIALDQTYLIGNPYPSALDADEFIKDNMKDCSGCRGTANTFGGAIYFWDHFGLSNNHILAQYEGGYATYTLTGGVAAVADDPLNVNNGATGSKIPQRYIPVGQGFFIDAPSGANVQGGTFIFKNSQRAFVREASGNSIFMKVTNEKNSIASKETVDKRMKIRLGFDSPIGSHRQILVGTDPNTSEQFDFGYDARMIDVKENDMFWELENQPLIIQGIPDFNSDKTIPLGIKITDNGESTIKIDALENIPNSLDIYLYDNVSKKYFDLRKDNFTIPLPAGEYNKRFSVTFVNQTTSISETPVENGIIVYYTNENQLLNIKNYFNDVNIQSVSLFNILKQNINQWKISDGKQSSIQIPIKNLSSAVYLVQIQTDKGTFSRKIIIK